MSGTSSSERGDADLLISALRSPEYQEARKAWLNEVVSRAIATGTSGVVVFVGVQVARTFPTLSSVGGSVPLEFWGRALAEPTGLSGAVAAGVVTALVALVATINVAVVVATWRPATLDVHHVQTSMWIGAMIVVVTLSGAVAVFTAMTQMVEHPALGVLLLAVASLAIIAAAATQRRPTDWLPAVFRLAAAERRAVIARQLCAHLNHRWPEVDGGSKVSRGAGLFVIILTVSALSSLVVVTAAFGHASVVQRDVVLPEWTDLVTAVAWTLLPVTGTVAISMARQGLSAAAVARRAVTVGSPNASWYRAAQWGMTAVGILLLVSWAYGWRLSGGTLPAAFWIYAFALQPVGLSLLTLTLGRRRGLRPGVWAAQWAVHSAGRQLAVAESAEEYARKQVGMAQAAMTEGGGSEDRGVPAGAVQRRWKISRRFGRGRP